MNVLALWIIYIVVVILVWLILWIPQLHIGWNKVVSALIALVVGALVVVVLSLATDINITTSEKNWLGFLYIVAFILPILVLIWVILAGYIKVNKGKNYHKGQGHQGHQGHQGSGRTTYGMQQRQYEQHRPELSNCRYKAEVMVDSATGRVIPHREEYKCDGSDVKVHYV